jgi:hypothetical protein
MTKPSKPKQPRKKPGPPEERLVIEGDWKDAVKKALKKRKPPEGWPKSDKGSA